MPPPEGDLYDLMHKSSINFKKFSKLSAKVKKAPSNLQKILTHMGIKSTDDEVVTYDDLDFEEFDAPEMEPLPGNFFVYLSEIFIRC